MTPRVLTHSRRHALVVPILSSGAAAASLSEHHQMHAGRSRECDRARHQSFPGPLAL